MSHFPTLPAISEQEARSLSLSIFSTPYGFGLPESDTPDVDLYEFVDRVQPEHDPLLDDSFDPLEMEDIR